MRKQTINSLSVKILNLFLFIPFIAIHSCNDDKIVYPDGGYFYPTSVLKEDSTFWCYPLKDILSTKDSFQTVYYNGLLSLFEEQNLSTKAKDTTTFRLIYENIMGPSAIITLTPTQIIGKIQTKGWVYPYHDTTKLSGGERFDFDILDRFFPLNDTSHKKWNKFYLDSLTRINPKLLDPKYLKYLLEKSADWGKEKFEYKLKKINISKNEFAYLVNLINKSAYWKLPYYNSCENLLTDADAFVLEANTPLKYNIVISIICSDDTTSYFKACQEIIKYAKMDKEIILVWDGKADTTSSPPVKVRELELRDLNQVPTKKKAE